MSVLHVVIPSEVPSKKREAFKVPPVASLSLYLCVLSFYLSPTDALQTFMQSLQA